MSEGPTRKDHDGLSTLVSQLLAAVTVTDAQVEDLGRDVRAKTEAIQEQTRQAHRLRRVVIAAIVVGLAIAAGAWAFIIANQHQIEDNRQQIEAIAQQVVADNNKQNWCPIILPIADSATSPDIRAKFQHLIRVYKCR